MVAEANSTGPCLRTYPLISASLKTSTDTSLSKNDNSLSFSMLVSHKTFLIPLVYKNIDLMIRYESINDKTVCL